MTETIRGRALVLFGVLMLATALLTACGGDDDGSDDDATTTSAVESDAAADDTDDDDATGDDATGDDGGDDDGGSGNGGGDPDLQARFAELMVQSDDELAREDAECYAGVVVAEVDNDLLRQALDAAEGGADIDASFEDVFGEQAFDDELFAKIMECFEVDEPLGDVDLGDVDLEDLDLEDLDLEDLDLEDLDLGDG